jgi:hypothetical protein
MRGSLYGKTKGCAAVRTSLPSSLRLRIIISPFMRTLATAFATCLLIASPTAVWAQSGLMASPNPLNFAVQVGSGPVSQIVNITFNGSPATITGVSTVTTSGQPWLQAFLSNSSTVTVTTNPTALVSGSYIGSVTVNTTGGALTFQVSLTVGSPQPPATPAPPSLILSLTGLAGLGLYMARRKFASSN